jgi:CheY-like chemotaxis protein
VNTLSLHDALPIYLPIVALSANAIFGVRDMLLQNGMNDYLAKPIDVDKLYATLEKWIPGEKRQKYIEKTAGAEKPGR